MDLAQLKTIINNDLNRKKIKYFKVGGTKKVLQIKNTNADS